MTRLARRTALLVAFYLITSAATAYAECAWVLWSTKINDDGSIAPSTFDPMEGFKSKNECVVAVQTANRSEKNETGKVTFQRICLPDTVDPHGTKGN